MELWIRSQDGKLLEKVDRISLYVAGGNISCNGTQFAHYKTRERAFQILDEIQEKMKDKYLLKLKNDILLSQETIENAKKYFEELNNIPLITGDNNFDIQPINNNVIIYQMPKE